jgi:hypothetical protein
MMMGFLSVCAIGATIIGTVLTIRARRRRDRRREERNVDELPTRFWHDFYRFLAKEREQGGGLEV